MYHKCKYSLLIYQSLLKICSKLYRHVMVFCTDTIILRQLMRFICIILSYNLITVIFFKKIVLIKLVYNQFIYFCTCSQLVSSSFSVLLPIILPQKMKYDQSICYTLACLLLLSCLTMGL